MTATGVEVSFEVEGVHEALVVRSLSGREAISELYRFELTASTEQAGFDFGAQVGKSARITLRSGDQERHVHGLVCRFEQPHDSDGRSSYRAVVVPRVWLLDMAAGCRVLSGLSVPQIVARVLGEHGITDVRFKLIGSYEKRDVVMQYRESDWAFLSRLMESEGIYYYFEHGEASHVLVITDVETSHDSIDGGEALPYRPEGGAMATEEGIASFGLAHQIRPGRLTVRDYPFDNPRLPKEETAAADDEDSAIALYEFPATRADLRLRQLRVSRRVASGRARSLRPVPGRIFALGEHPREDYDARYLLTSVEHSYDAPDGTGGATRYLLSFTCIPAEQPYRPERKTPVPRIHSVQSATVVGPPGLEIHTDEHGRVLVQFQWDRATTTLESACWLPVAHHAAGAGHGAVNLPRVGDGVLVEFLDGDPDRPLVTGRVYTTLNKHPYSLPASSTKAVFRDASTPGGNGYNELTFDSAAGSEQVYLRAQRNLRTEVLRDAERSVGQDDKLSVARDRSVTIDGASTLAVGGDDSAEITGSQSLAVDGSRTITVEGDQVTQITGAARREVGGDLTETARGNYQAAVQGTEQRATTGDVTRIVEGSRTASIGGDQSTTIIGNDSTTITGNRTESVTGNLQQVVDGITTQVHSSLQMAVTSDLSLRAEGELRLESSTIEKIGAPKIYIAAGSKLYLRAREEIILEVGDSRLTIVDGKIYITNGGSTKTLSGDTVSINC